MKSKTSVGFREVAERAGVSLTTVERVLNERGSVSPTTRAKVLAAAKSLNIRRILPNPDYRNLHIEAILPINSTQYWAKLSEGLKQVSKLLPRGITVYRTFVNENDPPAMIEAITSSRRKRSALIVAAEINDEVARCLEASVRNGEVLVLVSTRVPGLPAHAFSGIDNFSAGRTAASLINFAMRGHAGRILVLQATEALQSHRDRVEGFLRHLNPNLSAEVVVTNEIAGASWDSLSAEIAKGDDVVAIYETADSGDEIAPILRELGVRPIWIGHERNEVHDNLMREGVLDFVIDQDPFGQATWALSSILYELGVAGSPLMHEAMPELRIFCAANLEPLAIDPSKPR